MNGGNATTTGGILGPTVAGTWYPADRAGLERQLDGFLADAADEARELSDRSCTRPTSSGCTCPPRHIYRCVYMYVYTYIYIYIYIYMYTHT